jgi:L-fuconolactonase
VIGAPDFGANLKRFAKDRRFVGMRGFLWSPGTISLDAAQRQSLDDLSHRGMTLDLISRGTTNPKPTVEALCAAYPKLRIIIDHLGGAQGATPTPQWERSMRRLADLCPNLSMKFSSFYDLYQVGDGNSAWVAPVDLAAYKAHFDVLMTAFGPNRLVWGSNWPVSDLGGGISQQIAIAEQYLAPFGQELRDKVMFRNAMSFYRRIASR